MGAKRLRDGSDQDTDKPQKSEQKKLRALPSFHTVIKEAVMVKTIQNLFGALEPLIRRTVREEFERVLHTTRYVQRSPQMQIEDVESPNLRLVFTKPLTSRIFTGSKVEDLENNPLQILLIDTQNGNNSPATLPMPIKLEVVVLDGDFPSELHDNWTSTNFSKSIVKERRGKRPLLTGEFPVILRDGFASIGELTFTDNSSWIRSQHFRIGARVVQDGYKGPRIREAITEAFRVKDHRGESYKKHYPPALTDDVWRLCQQRVSTLSMNS
ncbi:uncharacterized protein A4U43_C01F31730 [Asparagus officinalis]|uniref:Calmodulin binding protein-like N-terminal domain-containing protein n=1 Tax=Asparagus officinalis TaxID=4686 RepID=A0A5P1FTN1_ASPOF|nr:uncharacterized protein A4U43_C01F31730 [Asparagus officinalis]